MGGDAHAFYDKLQAVLIAAGFDALGRHRPGRRTIAILERRAEHGLIKGERIGCRCLDDGANAALRTIVRRDSGEGYRDMLICMARESGIETPTADPPLEDCPRQWLMYDIDNYAIPPV